MAESSRSQPASARDWMLTLPKQSCDSASHLQQIFTDLAVVSAVFQLEQGEQTSYEHWQAFVRFRNQKRFKTLKNQLSSAGLATAHIEPRRGSVAQAVAYCSKEATRIEGPYFYGDSIDTSSHQGHRSDLQKLRSMVLDDGMSVEQVLLADEAGTAARYVSYLRDLVQARDRRASKGFRHLEVIYLYGRPGVGKSRWAMEHYGDDAYRVTDYDHPFDGYQGEETLILDEFDGSLSLTLLLNVLDGYPMELPARYHNRMALYTRVVIISNSPICDFYPLAQEGMTELRQKALYRRITRYIFMNSKGKPQDRDLPTVLRAEDIF